MEITVGSLFDGIGGWCIATERNGAVPLWSSEIEPFCMEITKKHFPNVIELGDIRKIKGDKIPLVEIICAGSPCQDLSVAGKREGLKDERSDYIFPGSDGRRNGGFRVLVSAPGQPWSTVRGNAG